MNITESQKLLLDIIEYAETENLSTFRLISCWSEYRFYIGKRKSYKVLVKGLKKSSDRIFKNYCARVPAGISNFNSLLAYQRLIKVSDFYKKEVETISAMIDEYETYLSCGNFFWSFLGATRAQIDMHDFRE